MGGKSTRIGAYKCYQYRKPFTVKSERFEVSHVKMHLWLQAMFPLSWSKKGISNNHFHRILGVNPENCVIHVASHPLAMCVISFSPMGGEGAVVEADEIYFADKEHVTKRTKKG